MLRPLRRSHRPFPVGPKAIRVTYGPQDRPGSTISGLRGVRVGRKSVRGMERRRRQEVTGRPLRPPSVRPTTERPRSLPATAPATAVSGGSRERYCGRPRGWLEPLLGGSASLPFVGTKGLTRGLPLRSPTTSSLTLVSSRAAAGPERVSARRAAVCPAATRRLTKRPGPSHAARRSETRWLGQVALLGARSADSRGGRGRRFWRRSPPSTAPIAARKPMGSKGGGAAPCQTAVFNTASAGLSPWLFTCLGGW